MLFNCRKYTVGLYNKNTMCCNDDTSIVGCYLIKNKMQNYNCNVKMPVS